MNKNLILKKVLIAIFIVVILGTNFATATKATIIDTTKKASLTITKYEHANGSKENVELAGVEFTVYLIPETINNVYEAIQYIGNNKVTSYTKTTPENGTVKFSNLELGRYLVVETNAPKNVTTKMESFLIDLPRTNDNGNGWNYDVTVYPKNITIYGTVILEQVTQENKPLQGVTWILQKLNSLKWEKYDYKGTLVTDENGQIKIENLEIGDYRLIPENAPKGYIVDGTNYIEFKINGENINQKFTSKTEKLEINKYILKDTHTYKKDVGAFKKDTNSWKIVTDVANIISKMVQYKISDNLPQGLNYKNDSIKIYGINKDDEKIELSSECYVKNLSSNNLELDFDTKKLEDYKQIVVEYDTNFEDNVSYGNFVSTANLIYTDYISEQGTSDSTYEISSDASVHTGSVLIKKTDQYGEPLLGAVFKIATSKENAKEEKFITDKNGEDVTATSDKNGNVIFDGLKYDGVTEYWIVEIQAPSYEEEGEIKYYNLLEIPTKISVNSDSQIYSEDFTTTIINKKGFVLPKTGGKLSIISIALGLCIISIVIFTQKRKSN